MEEKTRIREYVNGPTLERRAGQQALGAAGYVCHRNPIPRSSAYVSHHLVDSSDSGPSSDGIRCQSDDGLKYVEVRNERNIYGDG
jgi:hypothetical protein